MPKVSVIIPIYNHGKFIADAVNSVLQQTFQDFEIVITNDGSTDDTAEQIAKLKDRRIKIFTHPRNRGIGTAMNTCIANSSGDYISHLNADDVYHPEKLEKQVVYLDSHSEIGAVFSDAEIINDDGKIFEDEPCFPRNIFQQKNRSRFEWLRYFFYSGNCLCHPSAMLRKECFTEIGSYDGRFHQLNDIELWTRLCKKFEIYVFPEKLVSFRLLSGEGNITGVAPEKRNRYQWEAAKILDHYLSLDLEDAQAVFPEIANKFGGSLKNQHVPFYIAMIVADSPDQRLNFFTINTLYNFMKDQSRVEELENNYSFNYTDYVRLCGRLDIFGVLKIDEMNKLIDRKKK